MEIPKTVFYCKHCEENRYGTLLSSCNNDADTAIIRVLKCCTCTEWTIEEIPFVRNQHFPKLTFSLTE